MSRRALGLAILLTAVAGPETAIAQEHPLVKAQAGSWSVTGPVRVGAPPEVTPDERAAVARQLNGLLDILRKMPAMAPAAGLQAMPFTHVSLDTLDHSDSKRPALITTQLTLNLAPYERFDQKVQPNDRDTVGSVTIRVNDLGVVLGGGLDLQDDQGTFIRNPPDPVDQVHGYPVFEEGNGDRWAFIVRNKVPFWAPVTCERYLLVTIKNDEDSLAKAKANRAKLPAGIPASIVATLDEAIGHIERHLANSRKAYAAMPPAQRTATAYVGDRGDLDDAPVFVKPDETGPPATVYINPALIDARLSRSTAQILAVRILANDDLWPGMSEQLSQEVDWVALDAFVRRQ
jgi:hypothetical protein